LRKFEPGRAAGQDIDRLALEFQLYEVPEVYAGAMFFPWDRSAEVLRAWLDWTRTVPDEVTSVGRMLQFPPLPVVPEPLRGQSFAVLELVFLGDKAEGDELTEPLRALRPIMDTIGMVPPAGIAELHMDPREPMPYVGEGQLLARLDEAGIDAFVAAAGPGSGSALVSAEIRHLGGALARVPLEGSAFVHRGAPFFVNAIGRTPQAQSFAAVRDWARGLRSAVAPWARVGVNANFTSEEGDLRERTHDAATLARLAELRRRYDPRGLFALAS